MTREGTGGAPTPTAAPAATEPPPRGGRPRRTLDAIAVRLPPAPSERGGSPEECACCGGGASRTLRESRLFEADAWLVPYCAECHGHAAAAGTRRIAVGLSAALLALTATLGLPLLWQPPSLVVYPLVVGLVSLVPIAAAVLLAPRKAPGHAVSGRAVWFRLDGSLVCTSPSWGARLAAANGGEGVPIRCRESIGPPWAFAAVLGLLLATPPLYAFHFPVVRVLNLTGARFTLFVDGRPRAEVGATSFENARAGAVLRMPAGRRELVARDVEGRVVASANVRVQGGSEHLYAPASTETCFWVEVTGYGKSRTADVRREPLVGASRFWVLPYDVDFWFAPPPAPTPSEMDARSTGGVVRALRQARCDEAPRAVRGGGGISAE